MSDIVKGVRTFLAATTAVTGLTSTRIYFGNLPQDPTYPAIALHLIDSEDSRHQGGQAGIARSVVQVDCHADNHSSAYSVGNAVRAAVESYSGAMGTETVRSCYASTVRDLAEEPEAGSQLYNHVRSLDLTINHLQT